MSKSIEIIPKDKLKVMKDLFPHSHLTPYKKFCVLPNIEDCDLLGERLPNVPDACITAVCVNKKNTKKHQRIYLLMPNVDLEQKTLNPCFY